MKTCPRCGAAADGIKCRACGALVVASPASAPVAMPTATPATAFDAPAPWSPDPMAGVIVRPAPEAPRRSLTPVLVAVIVVLVFGFGAYKLTQSSGSGGNAEAAVKLPDGGASGLPSLSDAVRVQAEASRQQAFASIAQATAEYGTADLQTLQSMSPELTWIAANETSTGTKIVSVAAENGTATIAVSTANGDVCAFGRLGLDGVGEFVTMGNVSSCRAADAPASGWAPLSAGPGGAMPPNDY